MKYLGGKNKLGKHISTAILKIVDQKPELFPIKKDKVKGLLVPFCGSLGVLKFLAPHFNKIRASDTHKDLIALWKSVQTGKFNPPVEISEDRYKQIKLLPSPNPLKAFVGFGLSFGGKYFSGYAQKYTNGKNENYLRAATNSMKKLEPVIKNVKFSNSDYKRLRPKNMLIYADPPYVSGKFPVKYRKSTKKYDLFDNEQFWDTMRKWSKNNIVFISEVSAPNDFVAVWSNQKLVLLVNLKKLVLKIVPRNGLLKNYLYIHLSNKYKNYKKLYILI